jgi:hypothetical protein
MMSVLGGGVLDLPPGSRGVKFGQALQMARMRYTLRLFVQPLCLVECARGLLFHRHRRIEFVLRDDHAEPARMRFGEENDDRYCEVV